MANLEFCDKHNMVAYLKKPTGSEGFQEIVDFLNGSHIRYALTKNPTIYVSLIEKFWQTATVRTVDNGEQEITATVDGKEFTITEASVRRHLQLADVDGISVLPTTKIFDQLSLMGNMKRGFSGEHTPLFPSMLAIQAEEGEGSGHPSEPQPPPSTAQPIMQNQFLIFKPIPNVADEAIYEEWDNRVERVTTTAASLDAEQASGNINRTQSLAMPHSSRPRPAISGEIGTRCQEDQPEDQLGVFSAAKVLADAAKKRLFSTAEELVSTAGASMPVSTAGMVQEVNISIPSPVVIKDKVKTQSFTEEEWENIRARVKADEELTQRLQGEERNKYNEVDQAKMLLKELFETTMKNVNAFIPMEIEDRKRASELAVGSSQATITDSADVGSSKRAAGVELDHECSKKQKTNEALGSVQGQPDEEDKELSQEDLQQMMMVVLVEEVYVEALQRYMHDPLTWRLYDTCGVHHVSTEEGMDIFMLVEKEYPLSKGIMTVMLVNKLKVDQHSEMANEL
ncbi:hypothetical protein Tco_0988945 [Tanacetum coccineum]|uniref:Xylulose kinase-1 n=1 Tax=Tanacetum coccineum TaxID=301880 RepID=A0ABQ5ESC7_9ASTR